VKIHLDLFILVQGGVLHKSQIFLYLIDYILYDKLK
jgi:hypothetical protein